MMKEKTATDQEISFTFCKNFAQAETKFAAWPVFVASVTRSLPYPSKKASIARAAIVGGVRSDEQRGRADNVKTRTILTLDYDNLPGLTTSDIEVALQRLRGLQHFSAYARRSACAGVRAIVTPGRTS